MNGEDLFCGLNYVSAKLIDEAETVTHLQAERKILSLRRSVLIAAVIAMLLMLVGCAVAYVLHMKQIRIGQQQTYQDVFEYDPDTGAATAYIGQKPVTEEVLTLAGMQGSRNYQAAQEWFAFKQEYDPDASILTQLQREGRVPQFPAEYAAYHIYTQEMREKLDEILQKYDLKRIGRVVPFRTEELVCKALGLEDIIVPGNGASMDLNYAAYQECGNLNMDFNLTLPNQESSQCHIFYMCKDAFTEDVISLSGMEAWQEWNYTTASGANVLIFHSPEDWRGYLFCDMPNYTVTLRFTFIDEWYSNDEAGNMVANQKLMTNRQIKQLADAIDFSIEPQLIDGWEALTDANVGSGETVNGYSIELKSVYSDGCNAVITLGITAPEGVTLLEHDGYPVSLKHSNRWGFFEQVTEGSSNVSGSCGMKEDGDGKPNTQEVVLKYSAGSEQVHSGEVPFGNGKVWNIYWQDILGSYLNENTNEAEQYLVAEGTWSIDVVFEDVDAEELELIEEPVQAQAAYGWDMQGNEQYRKVWITSLILRPMSASILCDVEYAPDFLAAGERCAYAVMDDGSTAAFYGDNAGPGIQNLQTDAPIALEHVSYLLLPDGTKLPVPQA